MVGPRIMCNDWWEEAVDESSMKVIVCGKGQ